jgi:hypothetical protein
MLLRSFGHHASRAATLRAPPLSSSASAAAAAAAARRTLTTAAAAPSDSESYTLNVSGAVDKAHEGKSFKELSKLPPGALQGLKEGKADALLAKLGVKSVGDLAAFKHFRTARAIHVLAKREQDDGRPVGAQSNVNRAVDKAWERKSLREIAAAPPSALQGLTPADDETLRALGVKSVGDLGKWKYALWAEGIAALAQVESADFESR